MINVEEFYNTLVNNDFDYFTGVPDSLLKSFCAYLSNKKISNHIVTANEGNAVALASGYHIATGKYGVVYMQNSGLGNAINPLLSLADEDVYDIPMLLIIGYRGEPGIKDEPQHIKQGKLTLPLLDTIGLKYLILDDTYKDQIEYCKKYIQKENKSIALIIKKGLFNEVDYVKEINSNKLTREKSLEVIIDNITNNDFIVSTTGKTSREIFEIRDQKKMSHENDFLTVGSMGHASSIALGISNNTSHNVYCIDGDGALLMHMGSLPIVIKNAKENFKYILINNGCHESVGGQPTIINNIDLEKMLESFGFNKVYNVYNELELETSLENQKSNKRVAIIINTNDLSRENLGRPTITAKDNKINFQNKIRS